MGLYKGDQRGPSGLSSVLRREASTNTHRGRTGKIPESAGLVLSLVVFLFVHGLSGLASTETQISYLLGDELTISSRTFSQLTLREKLAWGLLRGNHFQARGSWGLPPAMSSLGGTLSRLCPVPWGTGQTVFCPMSCPAAPEKDGEFGGGYPQRPGKSKEKS